MVLPALLRRRGESRGAAESRLRPFRNLALVVAGRNPSFDYYFASRLSLHPALPVRVFDVDAATEQLEAETWDGAFVLFCRYVSAAWLRVLEANAERIAGVGWFIDDDIEALAAARSSPRAYRARLRRLALDRWPRFLPKLSAIWVSTPALAERWRRRRPRLLAPLAGEADLAATPAPSVAPLIGLHATASHAADTDWLAPVVREVLAALPDLTVEVIVDEKHEGRWVAHPRIRIVRPMPWPDYRADTAAHGRDLLLAPLLDTRANAARSEVKRIDALRCGAALLVSNAEVFGVSAGEEALGMLAPLDREAWVAAIVRLMAEPRRRADLVRLNRERLVEARGAAAPVFEPAGATDDPRWRLS